MDPRTLALVTNAITDGIIAIDAQGVVTMFNRAATEILRVPGEVALGRPIEDVIPVTRLPETMLRGESALDQTLVWRDITIVTSRYPLVDGDGRVVGAAAVFRDMSEVRRLAEEVTNLREIRTLNAAIFESTQDAVWVVDDGGTTVLVNAAFSRVTGITADEASAETARRALAPGEEIHSRVLATRTPVRNERLRIGRHNRDVIVDANPLLIGGVLKGSVAVIKDVSEIRSLHEQLADARATIRKLEARYTFDDVVGDAAPFVAARERARSAALTPATVVIVGESGTGKELFAHAIHNESARRNGRFIKVNCAALGESLLESELFGYVDGAFTGARKGGRRGLFEEAHGGTIFLDEIGLLGQSIQGKLLRVLQEHEVRRVGGTDAIPIDVRVIAATNLDLHAEVVAGRFREDLFYRLNVVQVDVPPLRARPGDLALLGRRLLEKINLEYGRSVRSISADAWSLIERHDWPGNVRELENALRRALVAMRIDEFEIAPAHMPDLTRDGCLDAAGAPLATVVVEPVSTGIGRHVTQLADVAARAEAAHIETVLASYGGNRTRTAATLGVSLRTLQYKMRRYEIA